MKTTGKVYFVAAPGRVKIGFTTKPQTRLLQLRSQDMEELQSIGTRDGSRAIETRLHVLCEAHRIKGEWFSDCAEVRAVIDDFMAGRLSFDEHEMAADKGAQDIQDLSVNLVKASLAETKSMADEIMGRIARGDTNIADLIRSSEFLVGAIICPALHGSQAAR